MIYGTDNGAENVSWPDGGTTPFHGEKGTTWEGGFRVPCIVRWPGVIKPGTIYQRHHVAGRLDADFLAAAGEPDIVSEAQEGLHRRVARPSRSIADGYNFLPFFKGEVEEGAARRDLLLRPGWRAERRPLERLEGQLRRHQRQHRHRYARCSRLAVDRPPSGGPLRDGITSTPKCTCAGTGTTCGCSCRCRRRSRSSCRTIPDFPFQEGSSLNASGINYQTLKAAAALKRLQEIESITSPSN